LLKSALFFQALPMPIYCIGMIHRGRILTSRNWICALS